MLEMRNRSRRNLAMGVLIVEVEAWRLPLDDSINCGAGGLAKYIT
jgi:hypothetical protein